MTAPAAALAEDRRAFEELLAALSREVERHPTWPDLRHKAALCQLELGDAAGAKRHLEAALERNPRYVDALRGLAFAELALGNREAAAAALARIETAAGGSGARRAATARRVVEEALAAPPGSAAASPAGNAPGRAQVFREVAFALAADAERGEAARWLDRALALDG
ncbi:MAG TPA: tetratricopeptide repeat protein, partial [Planctomycetota bacterium]|nr:tetratricopeptide repeat protein [Planctomycetota bacterium]